MLQKLAQRHTESERVLSSDSEVIKSVRDNSKLFMRIQRLNSEVKNQDKNLYIKSENSGDIRED